MKPILIYHKANFLTFSGLFDDRRFDLLSGESLDRAMFRMIKKLSKNDYSAIFIMINLSDNYLELSGFRMAHYIRLIDPASSFSMIPIILIGIEDIDQVIKITPSSDILHTQGTYYSKFAQKEINKYLKKINDEKLKGLVEFSNYLNKISIKSPTNYSSHHSVTNEWSLYRWNKCIKLSDKNLDDRIEQELYYLYLLAKYPKLSIPQITPPTLQEKGKILLIDDESEKGWYNFFTSLLSKNANIKIDKLNADFSKITKDQLCDAVDKVFPSTIDSYDVVLLDVRLIQEDFGPNMRTFSSYAVLDKIMSFNKGIQVIIFTASNKKWNYSYFQGKGVLSYIMKESPEYTNETNTSDNINELINCINDGLKYASFFKKIATIENNIKALTPSVKSRDVQDLLNRTNDSLDMGWKLLNNYRSDNSYLRYAFLSYYQILEDFVQDGIYMQMNGQKFECMDNKNVFKNTSNILEYVKKNKKEPARFELCAQNATYNKQLKYTTLFRVSIWLYLRTQSSGSLKKWAQLNAIRNSNTHGNTVSCNEKNVIDILALVSEFVSKC